MGRISIKNKNKILILGVESTAHTFGVSIIDSKKGILSDIKQAYVAPPSSGIHPREASRHHSEIASEIVGKSLELSKIKLNDIDAIAYSAGPGLGPCLKVGGVTARTLSSYLNKPLIAVNHAVGHIELAANLTNAKDPIVLLATGGHTLISAHNNKRWRIFGETLDATLGQVLDQFGRTIGLSSPSGPKIEELANKGEKYIELPYTVKGTDVSLSGTLTAVKKLYYEGIRIEDLAYSLQENIFAMVVETCERALSFLEKDEILLTGGVAANKRLQSMLNETCDRFGISLHTIPKKYSGDCGAQIAWTGLLGYLCNKQITPKEAKVTQSWRLNEVDIPWRN